VILDLRHPITPEPLEPEGGVTEEWYRKTLQKIAEQFVKERGVNMEALLTPPLRQDASSASYCPRCESEYAVREGECADCTGVRLCPFEQGEPNQTGTT
jgi:hypothetical protein